MKQEAVEVQDCLLRFLLLFPKCCISAGHLFAACGKQRFKKKVSNQAVFVFPEGVYFTLLQ